MKSSLASYETAVFCLRIECTNGAVVRIAVYPVDLVMSNAAVYQCIPGVERTAYLASADMAPSAVDLEGFVGYGGITYDAIASGVFDSARCYAFLTSFLAPVEDEEEVTVALLGKTTLRDKQYRIEKMSLVDALGQTISDTVTSTCTHQLGDSGCQINLATHTVTGTLTAVTSRTIFRDSARSEAADWFGNGSIEFLSGPNVGLRPLDIKSYAADGTITTHDAAYYTPTAGDSYRMVPGCRGRKVDCVTKWNNVVNAFAFWDVPTPSSYAQIGGVS